MSENGWPSGKNRRPGAPPQSVLYRGIVTAQVDRHGNLRLYERTRWFVRQRVFHPQGEWYDVNLRLDGMCEVSFVAYRA